MATGWRKKCDSYQVFEKNMRRSRAFLRLFEGAEKRSPGAPKADERELLRGAVVFSVGALDNFMHELILELVSKFGGDKAQMREPLRSIARDDPGLSLRVALARDETSREQEFRSALEGWLESKSFHGVEKVKSAASMAGLRFPTGLPAGWEGTLTAFTEDRHQIVHRGQAPAYTRAKATECVDLIALIGQRINAEAIKVYNAA
ncbi:hypothetical protein [Angustibacter luteus]|uniref:RiboL-PSP-HEPN domain-containing protein n=1 Tax=Angustibacter luteus TaxID=658456 RepID=A0ABW1JDW7_9ACTN